MSGYRIPEWLANPRMSLYARLCYAWGSAYQIERTAGGVRAGRRDGGGWITAGTPDELALLIRDDYRRRPVSRDVAP